MSIRIAVSQPKKKVTVRSAKAAEKVDTSGLTASKVRPIPLLFGAASNLEMLVRLYHNGHLRFKSGDGYRALQGAGLIVKVTDENLRYWILDHRHPAYKQLLALLGEITGERHHRQTLRPALPPPRLNPRKPLCFPQIVAFEILHLLAVLGTVDRGTLILGYLRHQFLSLSTLALKQLQVAGILVKSKAGFSFADNVPGNYIALIQRLGKHLGTKVATEPSAPRVWAYQTAKDNAPRLFGTDVRLRNLMAMAVYGPLYNRSLCLMTETMQWVLEQRDNAPLGRGSVVRVWKVKNRIAMALDTSHPLYLPLRRLLRRLAEIYPIPPPPADHKTPTRPPKQKWIGDKLGFFGSEIPTNILFSIGVHDWTFEALCCHFAGKHRVNIKKAMMRLEREGVLQGDRPRKSGFNVRVVTIADSFPAKAELLALLRAGARIWKYDAKVNNTFELNLSPRTKEQLVRRGLWPKTLPLPLR